MHSTTLHGSSDVINGLIDCQFNADSYKARRDRVINAMLPNSVLVLASTSEVTRNKDSHYPHRFDSSFYYLTGFAEPDCVLVLTNKPNCPTFTLLCQARDLAKEQWEGRRAGTDGAMREFWADAAFDIKHIDSELPKLISNMEHVYVRFYQHYPVANHSIGYFLQQLSLQARAGMSAPNSIHSADTIIDELRLIKDHFEVARMQAAATISAAAHVRAMQTVTPNMPEYALQAEVEYIFAKHGCKPAYNSIVAGGDNACILHYGINNQRLKAGDLVLIDAGAELDGYAADITRTFPVSGKFSKAQASLYQVVLDAQYAAIATIKPDASWDAAHDAAVEVLVDGLLKLGLLTGDKHGIIHNGDYKRYYMHRTGHWLGLDVHDVGSYRVAQQSIGRPLQAGMVLTVEPGLYIPVDDMSVDAKWRGIGIRIEDDVLVTPTGCHILTEAVPKTIEAIEALMAQ